MIVNLSFSASEKKDNLVKVKDGYNKVSVSADKVIFFDIETVPRYSNLSELKAKDQAEYDMFMLKMHKLRLYTQDESEKNMSDEDFYISKAALYSEYNRIVCISVGGEKDGVFNVFSLASGDERQDLINFVGFVNSRAATKPYVCGHNIDSFDIPVIVKKCFSYGIMPPSSLYNWDQKPWDSKSIDTINLSRFYQASADATLASVARTMGISNPKLILGDDGISALLQWYSKGNFDMIAQYCEEDIKTVYQIFKHVQNLSVVEAKK